MCRAWDESVLLDCYLLDLDIIIISENIDLKKYLGYRKVKTVRVYMWIGLMIIISFKKDFKS